MIKKRNSIKVDGSITREYIINAMKKDISVETSIFELIDNSINAAEEMDKGLDAFGLEQYDLDNLAPTLLGVYDGQQQKHKTDEKFSLLSLISMALLELGVIIEYDE